VEAEEHGIEAALSRLAARRVVARIRAEPVYHALTSLLGSGTSPA
jgi:hypothetical protein